ncbi:diguanylate cyclase [Cereibacter sphaeroides]|uniref:diguanylate cyclase n=1 Tax=Cereibacter sphaeroides TaxID=1063 RepID=UPI001F349AA0|nr:diguanylate cyclase [Cereibacter sphaeroides]MCE6949674.1 diguanylate cyclase [Cereibacter sphaeroides]
MIDGRPVTLYRYGGDEFALPSALTLSETHDLVEALRASIAGTSLLREVPVTISAGIVPLQPEEPPHHALRRADRALYRAKNNGRDRIEMAPSAKAIPSGGRRPGTRPLRRRAHDHAAGLAREPDARPGRRAGTRAG